MQLLRRSRIDDDEVDLEQDDAVTGRVLVVNDDPDSCELIARLVAAAGWPADRCTEPDDVLERLGGGADWSGVVLDLRGGSAKSLPVLNAIREQADPIGSLAAVVLTSTHDEELYAWQSGADGFLMRPFHADELTATLTAALRRTPAERDAYRRSRADAQPA